MPLFRALGEGRQSKPRARWTRVKKWMGSCRKTDEDGSIPSLTRLCLLSLADNMKEVWVKDYADNYLDQYSFRHIMGPFSLLPGRLVEELTGMLCTRKQLSRAALHLLLVPQLRGLSLDRCPGLVTSALCGHIAARCQGLWSLDLSGAQQLPSKVLSQTICCLPALRSLSLAGMHCDGCVIRTIAQHCCFLRHLDVSRCHFLSPAALLPLGGGDFCSSSASSSFCCTSTSQSPISSFSSDPSSSFSAPLSPLPLRSLLALDIGFGEQEGDRVAAAAYLLLSLPDLERVAMEGLTQACCLIEHRKFSQTDEFTEREGIPRLNQVWREWRHRQSMDRRKREGAAAVDEEHEDEEEEEEEGEEEERILWEGYDGESEEDSSRDEGLSVSLNQAEKKRGGGVLSQSSDGHLILRLKDVNGLTCDFLDSVGRLCPDIYSISVKVDDDDEDTRGRRQGSMLAAGLQTWSGQLQSLSVHFLGPLVDLLPALQVTGSSLVSLTLEGVKTSPHTPLLEVIKACPRLRDLLIAAEHPTIQEEEEEDQVDAQDDQDLPRLPNLRSLTLHFSDDHSQMMPFMLWMSLRKELKCLLTGSLLLEKLSLVSLPCPLNCVLQDVLRVGIQHRYLSAGSTDLPPMPLEQVQHIDLQRTDVEMTTVKNIMLRSRRLKFVDLSHCWQIRYSEWLNCKTFREVKVVWV
ncbi:uncharacterized protein LOC111663860 isoform X1 [Seriola lalandi dorsalis]|uniref:Si:ch211-214j8.12 n=1 Tax=Seriola lalandi dorsalis TaxID=1841481 RepID=A0A3B4YHT5_SERLL|nr:uncharacterized protein LOC111663860 isoform X1 [Seriola lalandi dorsalis]